MLNRAAITVRPKQPYLDWAGTLDDSGILPDKGGETTVYLVPEYVDDFEAAEVLSKVYDIIFEEELFAWHTREADWPIDRSFSMFRDWFDVEFHSIVEDICGDPLKDDENEA